MVGANPPVRFAKHHRKAAHPQHVRKQQRGVGPHRRPEAPVTELMDPESRMDRLIIRVWWIEAHPSVHRQCGEHGNLTRREFVGEIPEKAQIDQIEQRLDVNGIYARRPGSQVSHVGPHRFGERPIDAGQ